MESILSLRFLAQGVDRLRQLRHLRLHILFFACVIFLRLLRFFCALFILFCLRTFPYARPCVRCVRLNEKWA